MSKEDGKDYKAFIVEGEDREPQFIRNMQSIFFQDKNIKIITCPAEGNIYMLWKQLEEDCFLDIIEVIREGSKSGAKELEGLTRDDFSEIYLFFDYDGQHRSSTDQIDEDVLGKMLETFDNETEQGKLYISYPMVEALRDFREGECAPATSCVWERDALGQYKELSGNQSPDPNVTKYQHTRWAGLLMTFAQRVSCLFELKEVMSFGEYRRDVQPGAIYERERRYIEKGQVFVLSAFPEFLLDYYPEKFWLSHTREKGLKSSKGQLCPK